MLKNESCQGLGKYITEFGKILKVNKKVISYFCLLGNQYLSIIINNKHKIPLLLKVMQMSRKKNRL